jgi:cell division protein FtsN
MNDKLRIILVMSAILVLLLIGWSKKQRQESLENINIPDKVEESTFSNEPDIQNEDIGYSYYLVAGSFMIWENAEDQQNKITKMGIDCKILPETDGHGYYRVVVFWGDDYQGAKQYQDIIKEDLPKTWILEK